MEEELNELKNAFPEFLSAERNRVILAIKFFRLALEVKVTARFPKRPDTPSRGVRPQEPTQRQSV